MFACILTFLATFKVHGGFLSIDSEILKRALYIQNHLIDIMISCLAALPADRPTPSEILHMLGEKPRTQKFVEFSSLDRSMMELAKSVVEMEEAEHILQVKKEQKAVALQRTLEEKEAALQHAKQKEKEVIENRDEEIQEGDEEHSVYVEEEDEEIENDEDREEGGEEGEHDENGDESDDELMSLESAMLKGAKDRQMILVLDGDAAQQLFDEILVKESMTSKKIGNVIRDYYIVLPVFRERESEPYLSEETTIRLINPMIEDSKSQKITLHDGEKQINKFLEDLEIFVSNHHQDIFHKLNEHCRQEQWQKMAEMGIDARALANFYQTTSITRFCDPNAGAVIEHCINVYHSELELEEDDVEEQESA